MTELVTYFHHLSAKATLHWFGSLNIMTDHFFAFKHMHLIEQIRWHSGIERLKKMNDDICPFYRILVSNTQHYALATYLVVIHQYTQLGRMEQHGH